ncbi:substrate-binding periplasmic protein [Hahella ganghwensis]|uniref:substrate-binding periplasmic protein n=1 Tax=Hahella ganghwensis TaxID=286420 RepID=UPI000360D547|nr:transporter substrate-binding domain-containing protein [Hahella ganghwensis]
MSIPAFAERSVVVVGEEFPPFEFVQNNQIVGIDIDIITRIFSEMDIPVTFQIVPWKRAWYMVENGDAEAVLSTSRSKTRDPWLFFPKEDLWVSEYVFFVARDRRSGAFRGYDTILSEGLKVGIIAGNSYHSSFWKAFPYKDGRTIFQGDRSEAELHPLLNSAPDSRTNLWLLSQGNRIDVFPADKVVGSFTIKLMGLQHKLTHYPTVIYSKGYTLAFAKNSTYPSLMNVAHEFDQRLKELKDSGEYQTIIDMWVGH